MSFDTFGRFEHPEFYLCNPGCVYDNGVLTNVIGAISATRDEELVANFNEMSELNFRVYDILYCDPEINAYTKKIYESIQNRRMIFFEKVGFFVVEDVKSGYGNGTNYKDIRAKSCELEIANKLIPFIEDGTYKFIDLFEKLVEVLPLWKIGNVDGNIAAKYRTFEGVSTELNVWSFMIENIQDAFDCIIECDCINRTLNVYDQNNYVRETNIHLTKNDLIQSLNISSTADDLYTALNVQGDENLNISPINPLGTNVIYNFNYYLDWMTPTLRDRVATWQELVVSRTAEYYDLNLAYYENLTAQSDINSEIDRIKMQIDMYQRCRDNIVAEGSTATVESYNKVIEENGGVPVGIQNELADTLLEIDSLLMAARSELASCQKELDDTGSGIEALRASIMAIHDEVAIISYFTQDEYNELSNYIYEGSYTDEYIAVTSLMTYSEKFQQMKTLYDRAVTRLERVSEPTHEFDMDVENFLFAKEFEEWSEQLETGCLINVELEVGDVALLFLSNITVNYEDKTLKMTYGNRFSRFDPKAIFNGVLGDIKKSTNSINYIKEILYPVKEGEFDAMKEAIESSGILTKNAALASENQEIIIDDTGILGRKLLDNGEYDDKQIKITNQTIVFTDDGWETARAAVGSFLFNNPLTGEVEEHYGVIADTLVAPLVLSEEVGIYNTDNSITLDKNGFTLTTDHTGYAESQNVFTIQKKLLDENGNPYYQKQLYIDDDGNVVLNGTISIFTGDGQNTSIGDVVTNIESMDTEIKDINEELKAQADAIAGIDGIFFFVRYSDVEDGVPMYEAPRDSTMYMGTCSTNVDVAPTDPGEYTWVRLRFDGEDGAPGVDGTSQYFHVKYSNDGSTFTNNNGEELGDWMGTCVTTELADPEDFDAYEWHKIKGEPGTDGLDGKDGIAGKDGKTTYFHVKYSSVENPTSSSDMSDIPNKYIGTYVDYTETDSTDPKEYTWSKFIGDDGKDGTDGIPGTNGIDGKTYYLHIKYSNDGGTSFTGNGGEDSGEYIGVYTDTVQEDSTDPSDYKWSLIKGADGIPGKDGVDGKTTYFHIKYSDVATPTTAAEMTEVPSKYIGTYVDYTEADSTNPADYKWTQFIGDNGTDGLPGTNGIDGKTYYLHIKYSDDGGVTFTANNGETSGQYIGVYTDTTQADSTDVTKYTWSLIKGSDGIPGKDGADGKTTYFHVKYSNIADPQTASDMTEEPSKYIGTYVDYTEADSTDPSDYKWVKFMGEDGIDGQDGKNGIPGTNGIDGKTYYLHIKYSDDGGSTFTANAGEESGKYIGVYTDTTEADSTNVADYKWSLIKGSDGEDGITYYTWIKYADTPTSGMSDSPDGKKYMGLAYNKTVSTESTNYGDYKWSLIKGEDGTDGTNGINGVDGKTYYTWVKYADDASGTNMTNDPTGKEYIGLAYNKDTATESNNPSDYSWALFKGSDGVNGQNGADGISTYFYVRYSANANGNPMTSSPADTTMYMGVCSTTSPTAPTSYSSYTWTRCKGQDGKDGTNGTPGQAGADGKTQYLHIKYSDDGETFTGNIIPGLTSSSFENGGFEEIAGAPEDSDYKIRIPSLVDIDGSTEYLFTTNYDGTSFELFLYYGENKTYLEKMVSLANGETCILNDYTSGLEITAVEISIVSTATISVETYDSYVANGFIPEIRPVDSSGEEIGAYIGTLVDFVEKDSTVFSDYTWKKFTEDVDDELQELQDQLQHKTEVLEETIHNNTEDLRDEIQAESDAINGRIDSEIGNINQSITNQINSVSSTINNKYDAIMDDVADQLTAHKAEVGQYMTFNDDGLTLGASTSDFKTVIDNQGMYFKQGDVVVSYVNNNQLYIPNAVIESTLILGNFFFCPRDDGGVSLTWQE